MAILPSPEIDNLVFVLTGERFLQANEDLALEAARLFQGLAGDLGGLQALVERSLGAAAGALPEET
ncbi:hypothetical protein, partial [Streptomyces sp. NPDC056707]|uniref:hypothetical protein n=1 Tax=Streptomyces sp. NPDC056707 TaxID=3345919 RepID=UPI0036B7CED6